MVSLCNALRQAQGERAYLPRMVSFVSHERLRVSEYIYRAVSFASHERPRVSGYIYRAW